MGDICRTSIITSLCRQGDKERRSNDSRQEKKEQGVMGERKKINPHSDRKLSFCPRGLVNVFLYPLDQDILYLAFKSFTPYLST